jgi:hypothetical protein
MEVTGRYFGSDTIAEKNEQGDWEVVVSMTERRKLKDGDWEERVISTKCTDTSFDKAYEVAMNATLEKFSVAVDSTQNDSLFALEEATEAS